MADTLNAPATVPPEIEQWIVPGMIRPADDVILQIVSEGLNPLPTIATVVRGPGGTTFGNTVMEAVGEPTVKVVPAKYPKVSFTFTR
jgi:hypothetical protein